MGNSNQSSARGGAIAIPESAKTVNDVNSNTKPLVLVKRSSVASKNRSHHDVLAMPPGNSSKDCNLTQGEDVSPNSDREEEIRPSHLPSNFKVNGLKVSASNGANSVSNASLSNNHTEDLTFRSDSNGQMFCGFLRPPSAAGSSTALSNGKPDNIIKNSPKIEISGNEMKLQAPKLNQMNSFVGPTGGDDNAVMLTE